ncbi:MAG: hypothetical protein KTU85_01810 [Acidimicrobiia bacterium]|nr:hypothetical protein [Acidimicrobiia bacterium]
MISVLTFASLLPVSATNATQPDAPQQNDETSHTGESPAPETPADEASKEPPISLTEPIGNTDVLSLDMTWTDGSIGIDGISNVPGVGVKTNYIGEEGTLLVLLQIDSADDPTTYKFNNAVPNGYKAKMQPDGSVQILDVFGNHVSGIAAPWAYDARGMKIPTSFSLDGSTLLQTVHHNGAVYPVVADPCGWGWKGLKDCVKIAATATVAAAACSTPPVNVVVCGSAVAIAVVTYVEVQKPEPKPPPPPRRVCRVWHRVHRNFCVQFYAS